MVELLNLIPRELLSALGGASVVGFLMWLWGRAKRKGQRQTYEVIRHAVESRRTMYAKRAEAERLAAEEEAHDLLGRTPTPAEVEELIRGRDPRR